MAEREFSDGERARLAREGHALPDGSYPMPDCDAVRRAIDSYGRAPASHRRQLAALIRRRNAELGCGHKLDKLEDE
jgi:hypothetical protein